MCERGAGADSPYAPCHPKYPVPNRRARWERPILGITCGSPKSLSVSTSPMLAVTTPLAVIMLYVETHATVRVHLNVLKILTWGISIYHPKPD